MTKEEKDWIDKATLKELLRKNRFEPAGSTWFHGERGVYHLTVMNRKREQYPDAWVRASKELGW